MIVHADPGEMRRTGTALMASALAMADPLPGDLERYLLSLDEEQNERLHAAVAGMSPLQLQWVSGYAAGLAAAGSSAEGVSSMKRGGRLRSHAFK